MSTELERLRRRLYVPGAAEADLAAYRSALAAVPPPAPVDVPLPPAVRLRRGPVLAAALAPVVAALSVLIAVAGGAARPAAAPSASPEVAVAAAITRTASPRGLTGEVAVQRLIDRVFADGPVESSASAADRLDQRIRASAVRGASTATASGSAGGFSDRVRAVQRFDGTGLPVQAGQVVVLSVVSREPASTTWQVSGWRQGEPRVPHPVVAVRPQVGGADRIAVATIRMPEAMTLTGMEVQVDPATPFEYRLELQGPGACAPAGASVCTAQWRGSED